MTSALQAEGRQLDWEVDISRFWNGNRETSPQISQEFAIFGKVRESPVGRVARLDGGAAITLGCEVQLGLSAELCGQSSCPERRESVTSTPEQITGTKTPMDHAPLAAPMSTQLKPHHPHLTHSMLKSDTVDHQSRARREIAYLISGKFRQYRSSAIT